jgi:hypothetical protein
MEEQMANMSLEDKTVRLTKDMIQEKLNKIQAIELRRTTEQLKLEEVRRQIEQDKIQECVDYLTGAILHWMNPEYDHIDANMIDLKYSRDYGDEFIFKEALKKLNERFGDRFNIEHPYYQMILVIKGASLGRTIQYDVNPYMERLLHQQQQPTKDFEEDVMAQLSASYAGNIRFNKYLGPQTNQ